MTGTVEGQATAARPQLTEISNAAVALHREHFGRGPGAAKTHLSDNLVVCVLTDVFTPLERTLIDAGQEGRVRETRAAHHAATEGVYKGRMEEVLGRPVEAHMSTIHVAPDVAVDIFVLGDGDGAEAAIAANGSAPT
ncbi:MAG TPA: Na-translocating system protein MpsC family protein [Solirubrobacterales bacterium]